MAKMTMNQFLNLRWSHHRATMTHTPKTERTDCTMIWPHSGKPYKAHGGDWDRWEFRGNDYDGEDCYCTVCGQAVSEMSPWANAALSDWHESPPMQRYREQRRRRQTYRHIKFGCVGRRQTLIDTTL